MALPVAPGPRGPCELAVGAHYALTQGVASRLLSCFSAEGEGERDCGRGRGAQGAGATGRGTSRTGAGLPAPLWV